jgi:hypothetical protein
MNVSVFQNFNKVINQFHITEVLSQIKTGKYSQQIIKLQELVHSDKIEEYNQQKKSLLAFTPSATFEGGRKMEFLEEYSGLIILDIDKLPPDQLPTIKQNAKGIAFTYAVFTSPSGNGLKILIRISSPKQNHNLVFNQVKKYYESVLNVPIDPSGKDITRLCFFSYDPDLYINPNADVFQTTALQVEDQIESVINQIELNHVDITNDYKDWIKICFALIDALGSIAREPFHRISRFYSGYDIIKCDAQFDKCLNSNNSGISVKSFFYYAKEHGISLNGDTKLFPPQPLNSKDANLLRLNEQIMNQSKDANILPLNNESTDSITGPQTDEPPKPKKSRTNKFHLVRDYLLENFDIRYNNVSTEFEYKEKHQEDFKPINENDIFIKMQLDGLNLSLGNLVAFLKSSMVPKHNPFVQYFGSLHPWDGETDYIQQLASFVILKPEVRKRFDTHFKKWLVRAVKCALVDSYFNKQAFILVHDKQNSGKSTFCRFLCPPQLSNYIAENLSIDKDSRILLTTNLLINLDELSTLSKFEINSLKSLFSKDKINDRLPYDRKNSIIPRRASFIGSTNQSEFLNDESGSVRWLCFVIESIDWSYKEKVNIDNIWSQAYHLFKTNFSCDLNPDEVKENEEYNRQFNITTAEFELIHKYLSPATRENNDCFMTATEILMYISDQTFGKVKLNTISVGRALKMLSFARDKNYPEKNYGYFIFKKNV